MWTFIDLFAGIGGFRIALENLGCQCVFSSEIDPHSQKGYLANYGHLPDNQDIRKLEAKTVHDHDCLLYTSPSPRDGLLSRMPSSA